MMTKMTGVLTRALDEEVRLQVGPFEYAVMVPEAVRRQVQLRVGQEITFHITEYFEGNSAGSRFVPRLAPEGRLYVGHSERVQGSVSGVVSDGQTVYRRIGTGRR